MYFDEWVEREGFRTIFNPFQEDVNTQANERKEETALRLRGERVNSCVAWLQVRRVLRVESVDVCDLDEMNEKKLVPVPAFSPQLPNGSR